jgi:hypothetical protein
MPDTGRAVSPQRASNGESLLPTVMFSSNHDDDAHKIKTWSRNVNTVIQINSFNTALIHYFVEVGITAGLTSGHSCSHIFPELMLCLPPQLRNT